MDDEQPQPERAPPPQRRPGRRHRWDAAGTVIASLVGLLALLVSGYTAYVERQQVRAEVWPYLYVAYQDPQRQLTVFNKGVGPAIVRSATVTVDGKPEPDWDHVFADLGLDRQRSGFQQSTLVGSVLSPGEALDLMILPDEPQYREFRKAMDAHVLLDICYCSSLGDCWKFEDSHHPRKPTVHETDTCAGPSSAGIFRD